MMKFSERRAAAAASKEQKRAERQADKMEISGKEIVKKINSEGKRINLIEIEQAATEFETNTAVRDKIMSSPKYRTMYAMVESYLQGDWLVRFKSLISAIPTAQKVRIHSLSWSDWLEYGRLAGFDEKGTEECLKVLWAFKRQ